LAEETDPIVILAMFAMIGFRRKRLGLLHGSSKIKLIFILLEKEGIIQMHSWTK